MCADSYVDWGLCAVLGIKLAKVATLKAMFEEESKQKQKILRVTGLGANAEDLVHWMQPIPDLRAYINTIMESGTTGTQLLQMDSDAPLIALGMHSEVDRKCLLLQLARVRARIEKKIQRSIEANEGTLLHCCICTAYW